MNLNEIIAENERRKALIRKEREYDPLTDANIPKAMKQDPKYALATTDHAMAMLRFKYDFEYWAYSCVVITDKLTGRNIPFKLNPPQRRLLKELERQRLAGRPIRLIMLKARQWGGSTLIQVYFAWIQIIHCRNWNSLICSHVKDSSALIRGMYSKILQLYPEEFWEEDSKPEFRPFERMTNIRVIPGRGCKITICSSENQDAVRGSDCKLAHLSEVAFWKDTKMRNPVDVIRSVVSGIPPSPMTFVVMESTANGVGNFFHREWLRAEDGMSDKIPFFVPWYEIDIYNKEVDDVSALWESLDEYERGLWKDGCTLEAINWYHIKRSEHQTHLSMMAEFPSTALEAFSSTDRSVFSSKDINLLRVNTRLPSFVGEVEGSPGGKVTDISSPHLIETLDGKTKIWQKPLKGEKYIACVDIGGRSRTADFSVIAVLSRTSEKSIPEVVAQWRGHIDHDLLAWKAAAMARYYNDALLVVESNTWETSSEGHGTFILNTLSQSYPNLYHRSARRDPDQLSDGAEASSTRPGFHTNTHTKAAMIANLIAVVRNGSYIERDLEACIEMSQYEMRENGSYGARRGAHDDILMTRAITLYIDSILTESESPYFLTNTDIDSLLSIC